MSANDQRRNDAAPEHNANQEEGNKAERRRLEPPVVTAAQLWTEERYTNWAITRYTPIIEEAEQVRDFHRTTVVRGAFEGTLYLVDNSRQGLAFMKTIQGPVKFT